MPNELTDNAVINGFKTFGDLSYSAFDALFGGQRREEREYNERVAAQQLDWANTAHQREVADLKAAGLNPWLSAQGSGSSQPSISNQSNSALESSKSGSDLLKTLVMTALAIVALV